MLASLYKKKLRWRIAILFSGLILILLTTALLIVNRENIRNAEANIESDLRVTAEVFRRLVESRTQSLQDVARPATSDHAFRQVYSEAHEPTLVSAMNNMISRITNITTDTMMLVDFDRTLIASTNEQYASGTDIPWPWLIERAELDDNLESSGAVLINDEPHQVIVAPLLIPDPEAWVVLGFPIDDEFANEIARITLTEISVYSASHIENEAFLHASSLHENMQQALFEGLTIDALTMGSPQRHYFQNEAFLSLNIELDSTPGSSIGVAIHGSLDQELEPYEQLNLALLIIFGFGLIFSAAGTFTISRSITDPIENLNKSVAAIGEGNYAVRAADEREDEIGELATAVNLMAGGLEEKERVRNLLGRVVSNEVAEELLNNEIELGGEEREVSVLFSDIRGFTSLSESMAPSDLLNLLNRYFDRITKVIEANHGIVDKFIGDAVMAVFGAPIERENHAELAVQAALGMVKALDEFNQEIREELGIQLKVGVGICTGTAVAGNMGSESRMNYTFVGDTVNLASRLEGLTKVYDTPIIVSPDTAKKTSTVEWQSLGLSEVKGKSEQVELFRPSKM